MGQHKTARKALFSLWFLSRERKWKYLGLVMEGSWTFKDIDNSNNNNVSDNDKDNVSDNDNNSNMEIT